MASPDRSTSYAALVGSRKSCSACTGLINPDACDRGIHDSDQIGPWSLWQGKDWGDTGVVHQQPGT